MNVGCFSEADVTRIQEAVADAEADTAGEIVTYIVAECEDYRDAPWKGALTGALGAGAVIALLDAFAQTWGGPHPALWLGALLTAAALGYLVTDRIEGLRRWASSESLILSRVQERAEAAFLEEEVFATRARSGILIFVALFERRALVMGDEGINSVVPSTEWERVVETVVTGMKSGRPTEGLIEAIRECGALLGAGGLPPGEDDPNELADAPRIRRR